ncbi:MAG: hypothetical protein LBU05_06865, partial [Bifidobacteriaceae bacterium]|nr:hypothetical protein [Bifidobacteriaceae bacterium]
MTISNEAPGARAAGEALTQARDSIRQYINTFKQYATPMIERDAALEAIRERQRYIAVIKARHPALA